jgi:hypothetical protein
MTHTDSHILASTTNSVAEKYLSALAINEWRKRQ